MKINATVECTPEEARAFLGLPDLKPMQAAVMARMEKQMLDAADAIAPDAMLKSWFSLIPQTQEQVQRMMAGFLNMAAKSPGSETKGRT